MYEYLELSRLPEAFVERLVNAFNAGHKFADFGVWLVKEEDSEDVDTAELYVRSAEHGYDIVEICDCRNCLCECFEEQAFGVEGTLEARDEEKLRQIASAIVGILLKNYGGGFEGDVETLKQMGIDVIVHEPGEDCGHEW